MQSLRHCVGVLQVIEDAFKSVMAKEPERQARLKAEQEEAERQHRQAELRRQAEQHKRAEEKRSVPNNDPSSILTRGSPCAVRLELPPSLCSSIALSCQVL